MEIYTEIKIESQAETVWKILINLKEYSSWNPFLIQANGDVKEGAKINIHAKPPGLKSMVFNPTIVKAETNRELRWKGRFIVPGLFDGEHIFIIEELGSKGVRLIQKEFYSGLLIPLLSRKLGDNTKKGFELMNQAVKKRAEFKPHLFLTVNKHD
jgi:hypothetical protein